MISCPDDETLSVFADGELPGNEADRISEHVASCERCSRRVRQFCRLREIISSPRYDMYGEFCGTPRSDSDEVLNISYGRLIEKMRFVETSGRHCDERRNRTAWLATAAIFVLSLSPIFCRFHGMCVAENAGRNFRAAAVERSIQTGAFASLDGSRTFKGTGGMTDDYRRKTRRFDRHSFPDGRPPHFMIDERLLRSQSPMPTDDDVDFMQNTGIISVSH